MFKINTNGSMEIIRGDSAAFDVTVYDTDEETGEKIIYTLNPGDTLTFTVKKNTKTTEVLIQKIAEGELNTITINPEDTNELGYGSYKYDIQFTRADGYVDTIIPPTIFKVSEEVTF